MRPEEKNAAPSTTNSIDSSKARAQHLAHGGVPKGPATMGEFDHILNWKLKEGSHQFPGKDGGTCINEAALVAAGFEYRPVRRVEDMPRCFSRPICRLAMQLNDMVNDAERQHLLPFVTRLACADTSQVERERTAFIASRTAGRFTFEEGLKTLEGALAIGRQAEALTPDAVRTRMDLVQSRATSPTSVADSALFSKIKSWLLATKQAESAG
jgi:hypothetical protein